MLGHCPRSAGSGGCEHRSACLADPAAARRRGRGGGAARRGRSRPAPRRPGRSRRAAKKLGDRAAGRGRDLGVDLVGRDLDHRVALGDRARPPRRATRGPCPRSPTRPSRASTPELFRRPPPLRVRGRPASPRALVAVRLASDRPGVASPPSRRRGPCRPRPPAIRLVLLLQRRGVAAVAGRAVRVDLRQRPGRPRRSSGSARILVIMPLAGAGTSASTLSVETSTTVSPSATLCPRRRATRGRSLGHRLAHLGHLKLDQAVRHLCAPSL